MNDVYLVVAFKHNNLATICRLEPHEQIICYFSFSLTNVKGATESHPADQNFLNFIQIFEKFI